MNKFLNMIKAMGLVFGDIGTSPIYTFSVIFLTVKVNYINILSILSLILWTLILVVTVQYAYLAMSLSKNGEGGAIVLNEIFKKFIKSSRAIAFTSLLTYLGVSLLIGDSVITPAMSILSAVEGLKLIPGLNNIPLIIILSTTILITLGLFLIQHKGTEKISSIFGPIMLIWFIALGGYGLVLLHSSMNILLAFNPIYGLNFILHHGIAGFFILSEVILCATGAEALYADMGHLGRESIIHAWCFVGITLVLNYLGQGIFLLQHPHCQYILFSMVSHLTPILYIPFLILSLLATVIASQAMISGLFSIIFQGISTHVLPLLKISYTSKEYNSQIYIGCANWFLLFCVICVILYFKQSEHLAAAYGLAVSGTMVITAIMICSIFFIKRNYLKSLIAGFLLIIDICFCSASLMKIPMGAYWSLLIASIPFSIILIYTNGHKMLYKAMHFLDADEFLTKYKKLYPICNKIKGTALFFTRGLVKVPPYIIKTIFTDKIVYTDNIFIQINQLSEAEGINYELTDITEGLRLIKINLGYMEHLELENVLKDLDIRETVIFYGVEDIETDNPIWKVFALIKKVAPTFVSFYNLPTHKVHGVITQVKYKTH